MEELLLHPRKKLSGLVEWGLNKKRRLQPKNCSPTDYVECFLLPAVIPALLALLERAKTEKCFERKQTKFNGLDFLTEWLYARNPTYVVDRTEMTLYDIPFVEKWLAEHPRPPLPLSVLWTEEEAAVVIQAFVRGYLVRRSPEVQELREYQRDLKGAPNVKINISETTLQQLQEHYIYKTTEMQKEKSTDKADEFNFSEASEL